MKLNGRSSYDDGVCIKINKLKKINEKQLKFNLDYFDCVNVGGYEHRADSSFTSPVTR